MFSKILVPFDGSNSAEGAIRKAVELAALTGGEIVLLTVYRHHSMLEASFSMVRPSDPGNMDEILRRHAQEVAEHGKSIAREAGAEKVRAFIKSGPPARTIVAWAKDKEVDLIVLGSRGLGSVEGYLLGSVSHKVTGLAKCPVLVV
ncbi:universal stress protein [Pararhodobacter sp.]|uniref:universal stress protein n=1 Tax=Pararhodobacter sp. TaxID=2127056 RepID=UPI002FDE6A42